MNTNNTFNYIPDEEETIETLNDGTIIIDEASSIVEPINKEESTSTDLVVLGRLDMVALFSEDGSDFILDEIEKQADSIVADITTEKGRKEIASMAYNVSKSKTALDKAGKQLKEEAQKTVSVVNAERKKIRDRLDILRDKIRAPLTEFENREELRVATHNNRINVMKQQADFSGFKDPESQELSYALETLEKVFKYEVDNSTVQWEEFLETATSVYNEIHENLTQMLVKRKKYESDQAELEKHRIEKEARDKKEREEKIAKEASEKATIEAEAKAQEEAVEAERLAKIEQDRVEQEKADAEQALIDAEAKAKQEKIDAQKTLDDANKKAEADKLEAVEAEKKRQKDELEASQKSEKERADDKKHRGAINREVLFDLQKNIDEGINGEDPMRDLVKAMASGKIRHVSIKY